jgi:hypothetical protein
MIDIQTLLTPALKSPANKREAQIVNAWSGVAAAAAPTELLSQPIEDVPHGPYQQTPAPVREEEQRRGGTQWIAITSMRVELQCANRGGVQGHVPGLTEFGFPDVQHPIREIDVTSFQVKRFRESQPRRGQKPKERSVGMGTQTARWLQAAGGIDERADLVGRIDVRGDAAVAWAKEVLADDDIGCIDPVTELRKGPQLFKPSSRGLGSRAF